MYKFFLLISLFGALMSYMNMDPMKSSFFLILSMMMCMPMLSFSGYVWFSYFICLLFLSGIFVILVYFSSLSKISISKGYVVLLVFFLTLLVFGMNFGVVVASVSLNVFYYSIFWWLFFYLLLILLFFMNFTSYFLNFSGALRKL
uniref:NADH dehydrogenase subunit 6 n=1 Tax=Necator americanus TaxID=51031 RepID=Q8SK23_NECAM|nr:NADH dehydrogenase subunit 6 [Necator americanus]CAD10441.2 NADH dehydrogenase subunit 6 [Necator americanus]